MLFANCSWASLPSGDSRTRHCSVQVWLIFHLMLTTSPDTLKVPVRDSSGEPVYPAAVRTSQARTRVLTPPALVAQLESGTTPVACLPSGLRCHHR